MLLDAEDAAAAVYALAKADPDDPPGPIALALSLGLHVRYGLFRRTDPAALSMGGVMPTIFVPTGGPLTRRVWSVCHELAEWRLRDTPPSEHREREANALAAALLMPQRAFLRLVRDVGPDIPALAAPWPCDEVAAALRYLEVTGRPGAVLTPATVRHRGAAWEWPDESTVRRWADRGHPSCEVFPLGGRRSMLVAR